MRRMTHLAMEILGVYRTDVSRDDLSSKGRSLLEATGPMCEDNATSLGIVFKISIIIMAVVVLIGFIVAIVKMWGGLKHNKGKEGEIVDAGGGKMGKGDGDFIAKRGLFSEKVRGKMRKAGEQLKKVGIVTLVISLVMPVFGLFSGFLLLGANAFIRLGKGDKKVQIFTVVELICGLLAVLLWGIGIYLSFSHMNNSKFWFGAAIIMFFVAVAGFLGQNILSIKGTHWLVKILKWIATTFAMMLCFVEPIAWLADKNMVSCNFGFYRWSEWEVVGRMAILGVCVFTMMALVASVVSESKKVYR